jgi:hypothetical protein
MGREARAKRTVIHSSKLFGGVMTAQEVHARWGFRGKCNAPGCGNLPVIQVRLFMLHDEFVVKSPQFATMIAMSNPDGPYIPCAPTTFGPMVRFSTVCACRTHQKELELEAAKAPSYVLVEIDRGPGADRPTVSVATRAV